MPDPFWWFVHEVALIVARATMMLLAVLALSVLGRRWSAALRHRLWCGAIIGLLLLPLGRGLLPSIGLPLLAPNMARVEAVDSPAMPMWQPPPRIPANHITATASHAPDPVAQPGRSLPTIHPATLALALIWLIGAAFVARRFVRARWSAQHLLVGTSPIDAVEGASPDDIRVRIGSHIELPVTVGALRPVVLLPQGDRTWPSGWRRPVLAHEIAHVRARDPLLQLLAELALVVYWFHPLVWLAARQLRTERELAADDEVLAAGVAASHYAEVLVALGCVPSVAATTGAVLPLLTPAGLKVRLLGILDSRRTRGIGAVGRLGLALGALFVFVPTAGAVLVPRSPRWLAGSATSGSADASVLVCARHEVGQRPIVGAEVDVLDGQVVSERGVTGPDGCLRWSGSSFSSELVAYARKGRLAGRHMVRVGRFGETLPVPIDLAPASLVSGRIVDEAGAPLAGTVVRVVSSQMWARGPGPDATALADADGNFRFDGLLYGEYRFFFESPQGRLSSRMIHVEDRDVPGMRVTLFPPRTVSGYLVAHGRPVAGARIEEVPLRPTPGRRVRGQYIDWDISDADGAFHLVFLGRTLRAVGRDADGRLVAATFFDWERRPKTEPGLWDEGRPAAPRTIELQPAGVVRGIVRKADGLPAAGALVGGWVWTAEDIAKGQAVLSDTSAATVTDQDGQFVVGPLRPGVVEIVASSRPWMPRLPAPDFVRADVTVAGEDDPSITLVLEPPRDESVLRQPPSLTGAK